MNVYPLSLIVFSSHSSVLSPSILGIIGDSNTKCLNPPSALSSVQIAVWGELGSKCNSDDECMYGDCTENECVAPPLLCPTILFGKYIFTLSSLLRQLPNITTPIHQITHLLLLIFDLLYTMVQIRHGMFWTRRMSSCRPLWYLLLDLHYPEYDMQCYLRL
jgi:hypothetical protein